MSILGLTYLLSHFLTNNVSCDASSNLIKQYKVNKFAKKHTGKKATLALRKHVSTQGCNAFGELCCVRKANLQTYTF